MFSVLGVNLSLQISPLVVANRAVKFLEEELIQYYNPVASIYRRSDRGRRRMLFFVSGDKKDKTDSLRSS